MVGVPYEHRKRAVADDDREAAMKVIETPWTKLIMSLMTVLCSWPPVILAWAGIAG